MSDTIYFSENAYAKITYRTYDCPRHGLRTVFEVISIGAAPVRHFCIQCVSDRLVDLKCEVTPTDNTSEPPVPPHPAEGL